MVNLFDVQGLQKFAKQVFQRVGFSEEHATLVSESLVLANLRGVDSHGIVRMAIYAEATQKGLINPKPNIKILKKNNVFALIDGDKTLGCIPANKAVSLAISMAKKDGIGLVGIRNLRHSGMLANYVLKIVDEKLFGLVIANSSPNVALHGFKKPVLGTNPLAVGFPVDGSTPIILDMSTSVVARGKLLIAHKRGEKIPRGWAIDDRGEETTDANEAIRGSLLPIGGYKGLGLAMVIDIICGIVLGGKYGLNIERSWFSQGGFVVLVSRLDLAKSYDDYAQKLKEYMSKIKATPVSEGTRIMFPNEREQKFTNKRIKEGIPIEDETFKGFIRLAKKYGIEPPKPL